MFKNLLFTSLLAFLATSCGGGHITTTPVVRNAPSASLSAPTKRNAYPINNDRVAVVNLGSLNWNNPNETGWITTIAGSPLAGAVVPNTNNDPVQVLCIGYTTGSPNYCYTNDYTCSISRSGDPVIRDPNLIGLTGAEAKQYFFGKHFFYATDGSVPSAQQQWYEDGYDDGLETGYLIGYQEGEVYNQKIIQNGQYTGLTAFPRRHYLKVLGNDVLNGNYTPTDGSFDMIATDAQHTIYIKWSFDATNKKTTFQDYGNMIIGELYWTHIAFDNWTDTWFSKYDPELHAFTSTKYYATDEPITTSFYPEVYLASTINGDVDLYFMGGGNAYQMGFADGQTYTIQASETYNNVFTIFTPAFRAVANFFNLNIGPFKLWYFFAIPLIVSLLILVLRLVKH